MDINACLYPVGNQDIPTNCYSNIEKNKLKSSKVSKYFNSKNTVSKPKEVHNFQLNPDKMLISTKSKSYYHWLIHVFSSNS